MTMDWLRAEFGRLASEDASDELRAVAAEVDAALRLSWIDAVVRIPASHRPTCDLRVGEFNVEVYCPQEHLEERRVVEAAILEQTQNTAGPVKIAIVVSHPSTGSGRIVNDDGRVVRDEHANPLKFPANKLIDRILSAKRDTEQFPRGESNILWLNSPGARSGRS